MEGYADSHQTKRLKKAQKIVFLVGDLTGLDVLDLGAGAGMMADYFASLGARVTAADRDQSQFVSELPFAKIEGQTLPLASASFDVVIFNHVIEHVGESPQQNALVAEIARVLRDDGRLYFAAPSKWALIEPHFRLPLLGALPRGRRQICAPARSKGIRLLPTVSIRYGAAVTGAFCQRRGCFE
jgi:2-polyprenyl-3-methyl-5-hydroxy-6-metoxy-1,4-benzoquinol methylase